MPKPADDLYFKIFQLSPGKGDLRRLEILHAAIEGIAKEGYPGCTFDALAKRLGTRRSHIVYYYRNREELLLHMARYISAVAQETTAACLAEAKTPEAKVLAIAEGAFLWAEKYPDQARVMLLFFFLSGSSKPFLALNSEIREAGFLRLRELLKEAGSGRAEEGAKTLQAILTGLLVEQTIVLNKPRRDYGTLARTAWKHWLDSQA